MCERLVLWRVECAPVGKAADIRRASGRKKLRRPLTFEGSLRYHVHYAPYPFSSLRCEAAFTRTQGVHPDESN
jgi:hypothetical protein